MIVGIEGRTMIRTTELHQLGMNLHEHLGVDMAEEGVTAIEVAEVDLGQVVVVPVGEEADMEEDVVVMEAEA